MRLTWDDPDAGHALAELESAWPARDAFDRQRVWWGLHGPEVETVVVTEGAHAMVHRVVRRSIGSTGWSDVEPFFGYAGPRFTRDCPPDVAARAWQCYSWAAAERDVICETLRLRPLEPRQHLLLSEVVTVRLGRPITYVEVRADDQAQMASYLPACRRRIRAADRWCEAARTGGTAEDWASYQRLAARCLIRNDAARRWMLSPESMARMTGDPAFELWAAVSRSDGEWISATVVIRADDGVDHTLFVANAESARLRGAHELLTHVVVGSTRRRGGRAVCLGGGRTDDSDDALLRFKRRFDPNGSGVPMPSGFVVHDPERYRVLCEETAGRPVLTELGQSVATLAVVMPYRLRARYAEPGTFPLRQRPVGAPEPLGSR